MELEQIQKIKKDFMDIYTTLSDVEVKASQSRHMVAIMNLIEQDVKQLNLCIESELTRLTTKDGDK